ncbi:RagB/SusD family nutrient uptake outer membrane protein [Bacteroides oleiciplenus]|uniref:RagB/SusD domain-containing protein n=1 Tax=Bacteroides oleiciplenus YIT 12058 TaxID=742727 RepID=K9E1N6_9BACE|nr:RagB/SusD family nutrient uptake outer membrane protein [Bacteroides oleiciplenus]EKU90643.1 hypothetical protein HMPREF9447_02061 [Bacteroides oleiciplenus YIT 12058]
MKRYKYYILSLVALCSFSACDALLDEDPLYSQNSNIVFQTEDNAELALLGCYGYMSSGNAYGQMWQEVPIVASGLAWAQRPEDLNSLNTLAANGLISSAWGGMYKVIAEINAFLESIDKSGLNEGVKIQKGGEAKFLRALAYYNLVSTFGDVPLKTVASSSEGISIARSPREEVFAQIVQDLKDALSISEKSSVGRANSWAVKAFLGKVYYKMAALGMDAAANWQNAKGMFDAVYGSHVYELEPKFANLFGEYVSNSKESIFQMNYSTGNASGCYNRGSNRFAPQASTSGINWSTYRVAKFAYDMHEGTYPGDPRIDVNFLTKWRARNGNNQTNPKPQVGSALCANDSMYTYPYWKIKFTDVTVPGSNNVNLEIMAKLPYADFTNPKNPSISVLENYEATHGASPYNSTVAKAASDFTKVGNGEKWPYFGKLYDQGQTGTMAHKNLMVYRYAEMLLLMADVYNELGDTPKAISLANEVLARARKSGVMSSTQPADWSSSLTKEQVTEKLYFERIIELCGEPNIYDMVRIRGTEYFKKFLELNTTHELTIQGEQNYTTSVNNFADRLLNGGNLTDDFLRKNLLLPIPTSEIDANPGLSNSDNNFGY